MQEVGTFVGLDVHKETISVAVADAGRAGEVRHIGTIKNEPTGISRLARSLARRHGIVEFVYEAGSCGYNVQRQLAAMGMICRVCAPSLTPRKPGERIKNDRRDAIALARLHRAGEFTYVWVPDALHEALRDLVRARHAAGEDVRRDRIRIQAFTLRCDMRFEGKPWSRRHRMWLCNRTFAHPAQQIAFQTYVNALEHDEARKLGTEEQIRELLASSPWTKQMQALQALKGSVRLSRLRYLPRSETSLASLIHASSSPISALLRASTAAAALQDRVVSRRPAVRSRGLYYVKLPGAIAPRRRSGSG